MFERRESKDIRIDLAERMMTRASRSLASSSRDVRLVSGLNRRTFSACGWLGDIISPVENPATQPWTMPHSAPRPPHSNIAERRGKYGQKRFPRLSKRKDTQRKAGKNQKRSGPSIRGRKLMRK